METFLVMLLWTVPPLADRISDPSPGLLSSRDELRNLDCQRVPQAAAHQRFPGVVPEPAARTTTMMQIDALICERRFVRYGVRGARDEAILTSLRQSVGEITELAQATSAPDTTWHVDAFYPEPKVAAKIAVAAKTDLAERGLSVSDRVPLLAAGDLAVMRGMPTAQLYPLACKRFFDQRSLGEKDAFLGIVLVDARETQLHAGVCQGGQWRWVR